MDSITREGCKLVLNEVYEGDLDGFVARGNAFFAMMPDPDVERELSEFSPLYEIGDQPVGQAVPAGSDRTLENAGKGSP